MSFKCTAGDNSGPSSANKKARKSLSLEIKLDVLHHFEAEE
jgi:hypothetical protein